MSRIFGSCLALVVATACAEPEPLPPLPEPPEGSQLVLQVGDLEVYRAFDGEVCAGTLRRIEEHTWALADLFGMDPPRSRLILYATTEDVVDACPFGDGVRGCARANYGRAVSSSAPHELVHMFANTRTGEYPPPLLAEGLAFRLDGLPAHSPSSRERDLRELLADPSAFSVGQASAEFFVAWAMDRFGFEAVLDAYVAVARAEDGVDAEEALAHGLGLSSMDELQHQWETDPEIYYPSLPNTIPIFSAEQLEAGVPFESACDAPFTEGPFDGEIETRVRMEIPEAGQYEVTYPDTTYASSELPDLPMLREVTVRSRPVEPVSCESDDCLEDGYVCPFDVPIPRIVFPAAGPYEFRALHSLSESPSGLLSIERIAGEECSY